jgi:hypothetical protein
LMCLSAILLLVSSSRIIVFLDLSVFFIVTFFSCSSSLSPLI